MKDSGWLRVEESMPLDFVKDNAYHIGEQLWILYHWYKLNSREASSFVEDMGNKPDGMSLPEL
jgi:hypothetical protein